MTYERLFWLSDNTSDPWGYAPAVWNAFLSLTTCDAVLAKMYQDTAIDGGVVFG